jgi:hypothetical protein
MKERVREVFCIDLFSIISFIAKVLAYNNGYVVVAVVAVVVVVVHSLIVFYN